MGIIIGKFRKKKSTYEVLEKLEDDIKSIEEFRRNTEQTQKKIVKRFIIISILVYIITGGIIYVYFFPASAYERFIFIVPLITAPVLLLFIKRILTWYYNRKIRKNQSKLTSLKNEKKKLLDDVMDKETYKVAKTILEKFAPEQVIKRKQEPLVTPMKPSQAIMPAGSAQVGLRYRGTPQISAIPINQMGQTPYGGSPIIRRPPYPNAATPGPMRPNSNTNLVSSSVSRQAIMPGTPMRLPREILPRDRSVLDKMVDYLVGDGPQNRYALICKNCSSHNGMALREEFDYLSFRCCYCMTFNPARKQRPVAPKLENTLPIKSEASNSDSSESESDAEGPIVTEPLTDSEQQDHPPENTEESGKPDTPEETIEESATPMEVDPPEGKEKETSELEKTDSGTQENISEDNSKD